MHLKQALNNIDLEAILADYPSSTVVSPHIFKKVSVQEYVRIDLCDSL